MQPTESARQASGKSGLRQSPSTSSRAGAPTSARVRAGVSQSPLRRKPQLRHRLQRQSERAAAPGPAPVPAARLCTRLCPSAAADVELSARAVAGSTSRPHGGYGAGHLEPQEPGPASEPEWRASSSTRVRGEASCYASCGMRAAPAPAAQPALAPLLAPAGRSPPERRPAPPGPLPGSSTCSGVRGSFGGGFRASAGTSSRARLSSRAKLSSRARANGRQIQLRHLPQSPRVSRETEPTAVPAPEPVLGPELPSELGLPPAHAVARVTELAHDIAVVRTAGARLRG